MHDRDSDSDTGEPTGDPPSDDYLVRSFAVAGETILFDRAGDGRWIQSDTTVELSDNV